MRLHTFLLLAFITGLCASCKLLYDPELETSTALLVVEGTITDEVQPYFIRLTTATLYSNDERYYPRVKSAKVTVSDGCGHTYKFKEISDGVYSSNPTEFVGVPGRTYTLSLETSDKKVFCSDPQLLLPNDFNVRAYIEFGTKEQLVDDGWNPPYKETVKVANLLYDIENNTDTLPRFRFVSKRYNETITCLPQTITCYYCWELLADTDPINITEEEYQTSAKNIEKQYIYAFPTSSNAYKNVVRIKQYRLNNETYQYYQNAKALLAAQGKMFDPIPFQLKGNVRCTSDYQNRVAGFFQASSVRTAYYALTPGIYKLLFVSSFEPTSGQGCSSPLPPNFWIP